MPLEPKDVLAIQDAINLYGHVLDDRRWPDLDQVFTEDAVLDFSALGLPVLNGVDAVRATFSAYPNPPIAHHTTNVVVSSEGGQARAVSKGLMLLPNGTIASWVYRDVFIKVPSGSWRIARRVGAPIGQAGQASAGPARSRAS